MDELQQRLVDCFSAVFPDVDPTSIPALSVESCAAWDSLAGFSLLSVVEEQFGMRVPPDEMLEFTSFAKIDACLRTRRGSS